jgi:lipopolysaccharide biosynthesis glycosyltransferase
MYKIFVGYDKRKSVVYHTFCQSVIEHTTQPVMFIPMALPLFKNYQETHTDGSNDFIYSRFLVPSLCKYKGHALFVDGGMIVKDDITKLFDYADKDRAVSVVKHDYKTKHSIKYLGNKNEDYPRKNWSSVMLWNCGHPANRVLTTSAVQQASGKYLHRFEWLKNGQIGELPLEWNWLVEEYEHNDNAKLLHYTIGAPNFVEYENCDHAEEWFTQCTNVLKGMGE